MTEEKEIDFGMDKPQPPAPTGAVSKPGYTEADVAQLIKDRQAIEAKPQMNCLVVGEDGTGKTGIVMDYLSTLDKPTIVIDVDLGVEPVKNTYHKDSKIIVIPCMELAPEGSEQAINYEKSVAKVNAVIRYIKNHNTEYGALLFDGISTYLKFCEYLMRIDKSIAPDGGVQLRYWIQRNKRFTETLDSIRSIPNIDKFFVGHQDFITGKDSASVKVKTNQMIFQRIICTKIEEKKEDPVTKKMETTGNVTWTAKIDKSKYKLGLEGKVYTFATKTKDGETKWDAKQIFEGLK